MGGANGADEGSWWDVAGLLTICAICCSPALAGDWGIATMGLTMVALLTAACVMMNTENPKVDRWIKSATIGRGANALAKRLALSAAVLLTGTATAMFFAALWDWNRTWFAAVCLSVGTIAVEMNMRAMGRRSIANWFTKFKDNPENCQKLGRALRRQNLPHLAECIKNLDENPELAREAVRSLIMVLDMRPKRSDPGNTG